MEGAPSDETQLVGVAERDLGAFRALYYRHAGWLAIRLAGRCNDGDGDIAAWLSGIAIRPVGTGITLGRDLTS